MVQTGQALDISTGVGAVVTGIYQRFPEPVYDADSGDVIQGNPTEYLVTVTLINYTAREAGPDVMLQTDQQALIVKADLPVQPQASDCVVLDGVTWRVVGWPPVVLGIVHVLQIRRESSAGAQ